MSKSSIEVPQVVTGGLGPILVDEAGNQRPVIKTVEVSGQYQSGHLNVLVEDKDAPSGVRTVSITDDNQAPI